MCKKFFQIVESCGVYVTMLSKFLVFFCSTKPPNPNTLALHDMNIKMKLNDSTRIVVLQRVIRMLLSCCLFLILDDRYYVYQMLNSIDQIHFICSMISHPLCSRGLWCSQISYWKPEIVSISFIATTIGARHDGML